MSLTTEQRAEASKLIDLIEAVARTAHYAADDSDEMPCGNSRVAEQSFMDLSDALDACDELPQIEENIIRNGWQNATERLRQLLGAE